MKSFLILGLLTSSWATLSAQTEFSACKALVQNIYQKMNVTEAPQGKVYFLEYTVTTTLPKQKNEAGNEHVRSWLASGWSVTKGDRMEVWQDRRDAFTVYPNEKKVVWGNSTLGQAADIRGQKVLATRDSLFVYSEVVACESLANSEKKVSLRLTERGRKLLFIEEMVFDLDATQEQIRQVLIRYVPGHRYVEMKTVFQSVDFNATSFRMDKPTRDYFLTKQNQLAGQYKGFQLMDVRKKQ